MEAVGEPYALGATELISLLQDPAFYVQHDTYLFLQPLGATCSKQYRQWQRRSCCHQQDPRKAMKPVIRGFISHTVLLSQTKPELLTRLREDIGRRLGRTVDRVSLQYRAGQDIKSLVF